MKRKDMDFRLCGNNFKFSLHKTLLTMTEDSCAGSYLGIEQSRNQRVQGAERQRLAAASHLLERPLAGTYPERRRSGPMGLQKLDRR